MKKHIITFLCLIAFYNLQSYNLQSAHFKFDVSTPEAFLLQDDNGKMTIEEKLKKYEGRFQIQVKSLRLHPNIPYNIDEIIETNQKENETTFFSIGTDARIKIFSKQEVRANAGKKFDMIVTFQ